MGRSRKGSAKGSEKVKERQRKRQWKGQGQAAQKAVQKVEERQRLYPLVHLLPLLLVRRVPRPDLRRLPLHPSRVGQHVTIGMATERSVATRLRDVPACSRSPEPLPPSPPASRQASPLKRNRRQRQCLSHEGCGTHKAKAVSSPRRRWNTQGKGSVVATKAVETQGKGSVLPSLRRKAGRRPRAGRCASAPRGALAAGCSQDASGRTAVASACLPEPGGSACCYWNGCGTQCNHPAQGTRLLSDATALASTAAGSAL